MDDAWAGFAGPALALGARGLRERTPVGWTYAEMLAHVRAWHELAALRLRGFAETGSTQLPPADASRELFAQLGLSHESSDALLREWSTDAFNGAVAEVAKSASPHGFLPSLHASYRKLREAVAALSDEQLAVTSADGQPFVETLVEGDTYGHYAEHQPELAPALPKTGAALAARVDESWREVREAIRHKGRAGLTDPTSIGWVYKELVAHLIGWLQDVPRRIAAIRDATDKPVAGQAEIDAYNARSVAERALVGPEALLDELDTSYARMREAVLGLSDEEAQAPRIRGLVATRTYLHWDEHEAELGGSR